jgi:hypothetical protein
VEGESRGQGVEMAQTIYVHMNKWIKKKKMWTFGQGDRYWHFSLPLYFRDGILLCWLDWSWNPEFKQSSCFTLLHIWDYKLIASHPVFFFFFIIFLSCAF